MLRQILEGLQGGATEALARIESLEKAARELLPEVNHQNPLAGVIQLCRVQGETINQLKSQVETLKVSQNPEQLGEAATSPALVALNALLVVKYGNISKQVDYLLKAGWKRQQKGTVTYTSLWTDTQSSPDIELYFDKAVATQLDRDTAKFRTGGFDLTALSGVH